MIKKKKLSTTGGYFFPKKVKYSSSRTHYKLDHENFPNTKGFKFIQDNSNIDPEDITINVSCIDDKVVTVRCDVGMSSAFLDINENIYKMQKPAILCFEKDDMYVIKLNGYDAFNAIHLFKKFNSYT